MGLRLLFLLALVVGCFELLFRVWRADALRPPPQVPAELPPPAPETETELPEGEAVPGREYGICGDQDPDAAAGNVLCPVCWCRPCLPHCRFRVTAAELEELTRLADELDKEQGDG